ncbi:hypothetical protein HU200_045985 [Digitaria exilis]|uniref:Uncharacterized protein n=1 Tax=Digitaria exilis TaxID=1010633 RepID=A0A835AWX3_9POAL|nr:hypothetical protein HU200_045985 [Digitaria exilis]
MKEVRPRLLLEPPFVSKSETVAALPIRPKQTLKRSTPRNPESLEQQTQNPLSNVVTDLSNLARNYGIAVEAATLARDLLAPAATRLSGDDPSGLHLRCVLVRYHGFFLHPDEARADLAKTLHAAVIVFRNAENATTALRRQPLDRINLYTPVPPLYLCFPVCLVDPDLIEVTTYPVRPVFVLHNTAPPRGSARGPPGTTEFAPFFRVGDDGQLLVDGFKFTYYEKGMQIDHDSVPPDAAQPDAAQPDATFVPCWVPLRAVGVAHARHARLPAVPGRHHPRAQKFFVEGHIHHGLQFLTVCAAFPRPEMAVDAKEGEEGVDSATKEKEEGGDDENSRVEVVEAPPRPGPAKAPSQVAGDVDPVTREGEEDPGGVDLSVKGREEDRDGENPRVEVVEARGGEEVETREAETRRCGARERNERGRIRDGEGSKHDVLYMTRAERAVGPPWAGLGRAVLGQRAGPRRQPRPDTTYGPCRPRPKNLVPCWAWTGPKSRAVVRPMGLGPFGHL